MQLWPCSCYIHGGNVYKCGLTIITICRYTAAGTSEMKMNESLTAWYIPSLYHTKMEGEDLATKSAVRFLTRTFRDVLYVCVGKLIFRLWHLQHSRMVV